MPVRAVSRTSSLIALAAAVSAGCGAKQSSAPTGLTEAQVAAARAACQFKAGSYAKDTFPVDAPTGTQIPIDHVVLIMQENRSFDHYFSGLSHDGVDVASPDATNPDPDGKPVKRFHSSQYCFADTNHEWDGTHTSIDNGKMDGFVIANEPNGERAMGYYDETDIPFYYDLARAFAISDRHFQSAPGNTAPNREFYAAGSSRGAISQNVVPVQYDADGNTFPNIETLLDNAKIDWKFYSPGPTPEWGSIIATNPDTFAADQTNFHSLNDFLADAKAGTLPTVAFVEEATSDPTGSNEHPSANVQEGQKFISLIVNALMNSPNWPKSALFITWDEHGGQYDHVPPPKACLPDDFAPFDKDDKGNPVQRQGAFDMYGPRVPLLLVSPYAKRGHVSHHVTDHTSILRFLEARFNLPALTRRDANAEPPFDMFDFQHPDTSIPTLRPAVVDDPTKHGCN